MVSTSFNGECIPESDFEVTEMMSIEELCRRRQRSGTKSRCSSRRRRPVDCGQKSKTLSLLIAMATLIAAPMLVDSFVTSPRRKSALTTTALKLRLSEWPMTSSIDSSEGALYAESWSRSATNLYASSKRERIKSLLKRATEKTGIRNKSTESAACVLADAASIGGLGEVELDFIDDENTEDRSVNGKKTPASTYSAPVMDLPELPEDHLVLHSDNPSAPKPQKSKSSEIDALTGDVSAAFSMPPDPLPFVLPELTPEEKKTLKAGERVQHQSEMGREGNGYVVMDIKAPPSVIWDCLLDFHDYDGLIPTVRRVVMYTNTHIKDDYLHEKPVEYEDGTFAHLKYGVPSVTRAEFTLSKFQLRIAAIHKYRPHPQGDFMVFTLDPACTNPVLQDAKGIWHTQTNPDGKGEEYTRVWLLCELKVSRLLPTFIVEYAAKRAMPRASTWLKPEAEYRANGGTEMDGESIF